MLIIGIATTAVSAVGATTLPPGLRSVTTDVAQMAAIDESNTTIGIADSDLYFASPTEVDAALDQMQAMGVNTVRIGIPWAGINPIPGYYNWSQSDYMINAADARGMGVLAVITTTPGWANDPSAPGVYGHPASPTDFGTFAGLAAQRYAGKVGAYEIWNEPNAATYYGPQPDPAGYTELLKAAYPAIKAADPDATVVGGVVGSTVTYENLTLNPVTFVDEMYQNGAQGYFDALSFHPYQYTTPFSQGAYNPNNPIVQLADIHDLMVANGDAGKTIWASEYGEPSSVAGEAQQAAYTQDMLTTWRTIGYTGPAFIYTLQDTAAAGTDSATPEDSLGLIRADGTWKPAAYVVQSLATLPTAAQPAPTSDTATVSARLASVTETPTAAVTQTPVAQAVMQTPVLQTPVLQTPVLQTPTLAVTRDVAAVSTLETAPAADAQSANRADTPSSDTPKKQSAETPKRKPSHHPSAAAGA
jgi:hypothetical protein